MADRLDLDWLEVEQFEQTTVVTFRAGAGLDDPQMREVGRQLLRLAEERGPGRLLLNCANLTHLSSVALANFITLHKKMRAAGGQLVLYNLDPAVAEILQTTRLDSYFTIGRAELPLAEPLEDSGPSPEVLDSREPLEVALYDVQAVRAGELVTGLARDLSVVHFADLETLGRYCQRDKPVAVALALPGKGSAAPDPGNGPVDRAVLEFIRAHCRQLPVIAYAHTSRLPIEVYCQALAAGAKQVVNSQSPTFAEDLRHLLSCLVRDRQAHQAEEARLAQVFAGHGLVGESPAMREVFRRAVKAGQFSDLPVLLLGETGTGKQRLAEAIHALDPRRRERPFLTVNCSALTKTLAESELFGHTRGAFSGAQGDRLGLFRAANRGTLLLDEIDELDPELQPKLLRVLQERRLLPVGEDYEHPLDVRIIAATNRPLEDLMVQGRFRADLYQRLNVFRITIPPLRERPEDVTLQARHFLKLYQGAEPRVTDFGPRVLEALQKLPWEGNTRQLENIIREALAHQERGRLLQLEDLPRAVLEKVARLPAQPLPTDSIDSLVRAAWKQGLSLNQAVEEYERRLLDLVLRHNGGNRTKTAADLGLTPRTIFNKIKKYQLEG
jgi:anti-anti-sigma factor